MEPVPITDDKICILVLGDFLGTGSALPENEAGRRGPVPATPDSIMKLAGLRPRIRVDPEPDIPGTEMTFDSLESLNPGRIFESLPLFDSFGEARKAAEAGAPFPKERKERDIGGAPPETREPEGGARLLDAILEVSQPESTTPQPGSREEIEAFVREVVKPHLVQDDSDARKRVAAVDEAISRQMSAVLHSGAFQGLEAIWRSVVFLLSRIDSTGKVRVYLQHFPRERLERDLAPSTDQRESDLEGLLRSPQLGIPGRRWALVVGAYDFAFTAGDMDLLGRVAEVARSADVPWLSSVRAPDEDQSQPRDGEDLASAWQRLRESPGAPWLGLTYPRILLREPFGGEGRRIRSFDFREEILSKDELLWGSGAFVAATLLTQGIVDQGGSRGPDSRLELLGLPLATRDGEEEEPPSSLETALSPDDVRAFLEMGVMPLFGFPNRASVQLGGIHAVSDPRTPLSAWWRR